MLTARNDDALRRSATAPLNTCNKTKQDAEQLQLLAIFHYIVAGLAVLFSFFPLLYAAVGTIFIFVARHGSPKPGEELPPEFLGWIFAVVASLLFLLGIAIAICILIVGCSLAKLAIIGLHLRLHVSNASSFPLERSLACSQLSCSRANR
jgi:hypothetical protein